MIAYKCKTIFLHIDSIHSTLLIAMRINGYETILFCTFRQVLYLPQYFYMTVKTYE